MTNSLKLLLRAFEGWVILYNSTAFSVERVVEMYNCSRVAFLMFLRLIFMS